MKACNEKKSSETLVRNRMRTRWKDIAIDREKQEKEKKKGEATMRKKKGLQPEVRVRMEGSSPRMEKQSKKLHTCRPGG